MKTILVTGVAGFIGSHLAENLLLNGYKVIGIDNFDSFYDIEIKRRNLYSIPVENFNFYNIDIRSKDQLSSLMDHVDVVIHLAAKAGVIPSLKQPDEYIYTNINGTLNILNFMLKKKISKLIFASSSSVYGNNRDIPFQEDSVSLTPVSPYAFTKKSCEILNYTYHHINNLDVLNLRLFTVYGPRQRPDLAIHKFFKLINEDKEIPVYGDGSSARDYTFIDDTINGIVSALEFIQENQGIYETINLGNQNPVNLLDLINVIGKVTNLKPRLRYLDQQAGDVDITFADISKAQQLFKYNPQTTLEDGLVKFNDWFNRNLKSNPKITIPMPVS